MVEGFTSKHNADILVWHEAHETMDYALRREMAIRNCRRAWEIKATETMNPGWRDLYDELP